MVLIKFFLHLSEEEQLRRFEERRDNPLKAWKLTPDDWENRRKRTQYLEAIEDMLERTDHEAAPWQLVEAESKRYARVKVVETVIELIEQGMRAQGIEPPAAARLGAVADPVARARAEAAPRGRSGWRAGSGPATGTRSRCTR